MMIRSLLAFPYKTRVSILLAGVCLPGFMAWGQAPSTPEGKRETRAAQTTATGAETRQRAAGSQSIQTGDGMLSIRAALPAEIRIGERFTYDVTVQNVTDNVTLHSIELQHHESKGLTIESVRTSDEMQTEAEGQQTASRSAQQQNQPNAAQQAGAGAPDAGAQQVGGQRAQANTEKPQQPAGDQQQLLNQPYAEVGQNDNQSLSIERLQPGESQTFQVSASADQEGPVNACLLVKSYQPSICLQTTAIKPELQIVKQAPERNRLCDVIELTYTVTNDGTGSVGEFQIVDQLAEGLRTIEDEEQLAFTVDELKAGDTRKFVARVYATRTGRFDSRAEANATQGELSARSESVGPEIVGADLQVNLESQGAVPSNTPAVFTASVTNTGNAPAENVQVAVYIPGQASLRRMSEIQMAGSAAGNSQRGNEPQVARSQTAQARTAAPRELSNRERLEARKSTDPATNSRQADATTAGATAQQREEHLSIPQLDPGQTARFDYVVAGRNIDRIESRVIANYVCDIEAISDQAKEASTSAEAVASTRIIRLPGLQIYALDNADPVLLNEEVTYTIRVKNEGDAPDHNIQITATLPEQLNFENADGPTEFDHQAKQITFAPIETLKAGEEVEYTLTATATDAARVQLKVAMTSQAFDESVEVSEPTMLYDGKNASANQSRSAQAAP